MADLERRLAGGQPTVGGEAADAGGAGDGAADPEVVRLLREGKEVQATALVHKQKGREPDRGQGGGRPAEGAAVALTAPA